MARDSNGNYTLPPGYRAETGQTILASQHNPPLEDIASALTESLPRNGSAPMGAPVKGVNGSSASPAFSFNAAPGVGFYFDPSDTSLVVVINGSEAGRFRAGGFTRAKAIGEIFDFAAVTPPTGALICNGQAVSRTTYSALFALIGTQYGAGDSSTTFNIPFINGRARVAMDTQGSVDAGLMTSSGIARSQLGGKSGNQSHQLSFAEMPVHTPTGIANSAGILTGTVSGGLFGSPGLSGSNFTSVTNNFGTAVFPPVFVNDVNRTLTMDPIGGGAVHNNVQPTFFVTTCIQAL